MARQFLNRTSAASCGSGLVATLGGSLRGPRLFHMATYPVSSETRLVRPSPASPGSGRLKPFLALYPVSFCIPAGSGLSSLGPQTLQLAPRRLEWDCHVYSVNSDFIFWGGMLHYYFEHHISTRLYGKSMNSSHFPHPIIIS